MIAAAEDRSRPALRKPFPKSLMHWQAVEHGPARWGAGDCDTLAVMHCGTRYSRLRRPYCLDPCDTQFL
jgi:hypothetical protein